MGLNIVIYVLSKSNKMVIKEREKDETKYKNRYFTEVARLVLRYFKGRPHNEVREFTEYLKTISERCAFTVIPPWYETAFETEEQFYGNSDFLVELPKV